MSVILTYVHNLETMNVVMSFRLGVWLLKYQLLQMLVSTLGGTYWRDLLSENLYTLSMLVCCPNQFYLNL